MSNVDRVGPTPPPGSTSKGSAASPKNFQETMKQVEKVQEIDPDEASRRQRASDVDTLAAKKKGEEVAAAAIVPAKPARSPVVNSKEFQKTLQKVEKLEKTDAENISFENVRVESQSGAPLKTFRVKDSNLALLK